MIPVRRILWFLLQVALFLVGLMAFFVWAPWQAAIPLSEAPASVIAAMPANCPAVEVNHGVYSCFWEGTKSSNPLGFALCSVLCFGSMAIAAFIGLTGRGLQRQPE